MLKHVEIYNEWGKCLRGYLTIPDHFDGLIVIMFHGFTGNKTEHGGLFRDFSRLLEEHNIASLRMDFSGNGESDGSFKDFTFDTMMAEANMLIDYVKSLQEVKKISLLGFSMGGAIASYIATQRYREIDKLLLWSPAGNIKEIIKNKFEKSPKLDNGNADLGNFELSKEMYESINKYNMYDSLGLFSKPVFIVHGKKDIAVNYHYGIKYQEGFPNAKIHLIETAGHGYDRRTEKIELLKESLDFLKG